MLFRSTGNITSGAYVGITGYESSPTAQAFADGYTAAKVPNINQYFFADNKSYKINASGGNLTLATGGTTSTLASAWTTAVNNNGTFKMTSNWVATAHETFTTAFNTDGVTSTALPFYNGGLNVPAGKTVTLDLNGYTLNRALATTKEEGRVITVAGTLIIQDTSSGGGGTITGGNSGSHNGDRKSVV